MPDISICKNYFCPLNKSCYRFTATPSEFKQTYGMFEYDETNKSCEYYWKTEYDTDTKKDKEENS